MKFKELSGKSKDELSTMLENLREQLRELYVKAKLQQVKNPHQLSGLRKDIARVLTALNRE